MPIALGLGSPLWFYAVSRLGTRAGRGLWHGGFCCVPCGRAAARRRSSPALLVGAGRHRFATRSCCSCRACSSRSGGAGATRVALIAAVGGVLIPLAPSRPSIEVWWFQRPLAAHLRHAVHLVQTAMHVTDAPNPDVPVAAGRSRCASATTPWCEYWLLGYGARLGSSPPIAAGLAAALADPAGAGDRRSACCCGSTVSPRASRPRTCASS